MQSNLPRTGRQPNNAPAQAEPPASQRRYRSLVVAATGCSWLGFTIHNFADLPGQSLLSPETALPTVIYLLLIGGWLTPAWRIAGWLLLAWGWLHLIGGAVISVLPLPFLPFAPDQSLRHYAFHVLYGISQVPLLILVSRALRHNDVAAGQADRPVSIAE